MPGIVCVVRISSATVFGMEIVTMISKFQLRKQAQRR